MRTTLLAGAGFLLVQVGWILAVAPQMGIDEFDHALRASSVAEGHWRAGNDPLPADLGRGDLIPVREDVAGSVRAACEFRTYTGKYNCEPKQDLDQGEVLIASGAARYNPTFYAVVGTLAAPFHGTANLYALRATTALLGCALFMLVVWLAAGAARTRWPVAAVGLAALPTTLYSVSIASPNGLEMISGVGTWVALLAVVEARDDQRRRRSAYLLLAVFAALLANLHTMGLVWLGLIVVAVAVLHGPGRVLRALLPTRGVEIAASALAVVAVLAEAFWILTSGANDPGASTEVINASPWSYVLDGVLLWPLQAVGAFPMRNDHAPGSVYAVEITVLVVVAVLALRRTSVRSHEGAALGFVAVVSYLVPAALTVITFHSLGAAWQGRYGMPFTAGLLVLAGRQLDLSTRQPRLRSFVPFAVAALVLAQLLSQWSVVTMLRTHSALVSDTHWHPPALVLLAGLAVLASCCWYGALRDSTVTRRSASVDQAALEQVPA